MEKIEYPKVKYHKSEQPKIVQNKEQDAALGKEWSEAPVESAEVEKAPKKSKKDA